MNIIREQAWFKQDDKPKVLRGKDINLRESQIQQNSRWNFLWLTRSNPKTPTAKEEFETDFECHSGVRNG